MSSGSNVLVRILKSYKFNPETDVKPYLELYPILTARNDIFRRGPMLLDELNYVHLRWQGYKSITHRRSCREGICGSCAMNVNVLIHLLVFIVQVLLLVPLQFTLYLICLLFVI
jgi:succinate dehydrogenase/fumarate reductase-like Fe-S protein